MDKYFLNKLENGLKYILIENKNVETCSITICVNVGSVNETGFKSGISHFLEHMVFKGSKKYQEMDLINNFENKGISFNASTDKDVTMYYAKTNKIFIKDCIELFSEMLFHSIFPSKEIEKEKNVVIEEYNKDFDDSSVFIDELITPKIYSNHACGNSIIGTKKSIKSFNRNDVLEFYNKYYNPNNMTIAISGNFEKNDIEKYIKKYFSQENKNRIYDLIPLFNTNQSNLKTVTFTRKNAQSTLKISFPTFDIRHKDSYALMLGCNIIGDGMSSRLFTLIREKYGLVYSINCEATLYRNGGNISITASLDHKNIPNTLKLIFQELDKIKRKGFTLEEIKKAKVNLTTGILIDFEDTNEIAEHYANELRFDNICSLKNLYDNYNKSSQKKINDVMKFYLDYNKMTIGIIGNLKKKTKKKITKKKKLSKIKNIDLILKKIY